MGGGNLSKGFAISGVLYPILILVVFIIVQMLTMLGTRKMVLDQNRNQLIDSLNSDNKVYTNEELSTLVIKQQTEITDLKNELYEKYVTTSSLNTKLENYVERKYCNNSQANSCSIDFNTISNTAICFVGPPTGGEAAIRGNTSIYFVGWYPPNGIAYKPILQNTNGISSVSVNNGVVNFVGTYPTMIAVRCYLM